jgi:hypothetical protein
LPAKLVVTSVKGGSHISLLGSSGKELLSSVVFKEPRAKGATLRALKGLLGETVVEDHTIRGPQRKQPASPVAAVKALATATAQAAVDKVEEVVSPSPKRRSPSKKASAAKAAAPGARSTKARASKAAPASAAESAPTKVAAARKTSKRATARP